MRRVFCWGCSYTSYLWPTWADWLAVDNPSVKVFNMGKPGIGNQSIHIMKSAHKKFYGEKEDDLHLCLWTSFDRMDHYALDHGWFPASGSLVQYEFLPEIIDVLWSENSSMIMNTHYMLTSGMDFNALAMQSDLNDKYNKNIKCFVQWQKSYPNNWHEDIKDIDGHPGPETQWLWYETHIKGKFGLTEDAADITVAEECQSELTALIHNHFPFGVEKVKEELSYVQNDFYKHMGIKSLSESEWIAHPDRVYAHYLRSLRSIVDNE